MLKQKHLVKSAALILALTLVQDAAAQRGRAGAQGRMQTSGRAGGAEVIAVNANGISKKFSGLEQNWSYTDPVLSPDGKRLALTGSPPLPSGQPGPRQRSIIVIYALPDGPIVTLNAPGQNHLASWVGNTGKISFLRRDNSRDLTDALIVRNADGSGQEQTVIGDLQNTLGVAWSGDGTEFFLSYQSAARYPRGGILRYSTQNVRAPVLFQAEEIMPGRLAVSPDGSMMAFATDPAGATRGRSGGGALERRVYVAPVNGYGMRIASVSGEMPMWSTDSRTLFFVSTNDRRIYSARIRPGAVPRADRAVAVSQPLEQPITPFAALPGDSLFAMSRQSVVVAQPVPEEIRGVPADSATQKQLEVLAARALRPIAADKRVNLATHALETRAIVAAGDPIFAGLAQEVRSYLLPGRDSVHLSALSQILGAAGWVADSPDCPDRPSAAPCRIGSYAAALDFSPAIMSADSARIYAHSYRRADSAAGVNVAIVTRWSFTFGLGARGWSLVRVE